MKTNLNHLVLVLSILSLSFFFIGCKNEVKTSVNTTTNENPYIYSYTSGIISTQAEIQIIFASTQLTGAEPGKELENGILTIKPALDGKVYWKNKHTLVFEPANPMPVDKNYQITLLVSNIIGDAKSPYDIFSFSFKTREQHLGLNIEGLKIFNNQPENNINFLATVLTEDVVSKEKLNECISATLDGEKIDISWEDNQDSRTHSFSIPNISQIDKEQYLAISLKGGAIQAPEEFEVIQNIPQAGVFKLMQVRRVNNTSDGLRIEFSEMLDPNQDLEGLVQIEDQSDDIPYLIEENVVRLFPDDLISGNLMLQINPGIRSRSGKVITTTVKEPFFINPSLPGVSLVSQGAIVPSTKGVFFPFNAIGLSAVDVEIFKVGSQNIITLLKDNDINEAGYQMYRVGKIIKQKTIQLDHLNPLEDGLTWKKYFLDLNDLIKTDPGAIYQIRIGFRQEYAINPCGDQMSIEKDKALSDQIYFRDEQGNQTSILDNFYGGITSYEDYQWENRDNPCFPEYYNANRFISGNLLVSDFGISAKIGSDDLAWVSVSDLITTKPLSDINISLYDEANELISSQQTNNDGVSLIPLNGFKPAVIVAQEGKNKGYLRLKEEDALNLSRFDVSGEQIKGDVKGFIYAERNIWRPGDSMFFNFMLQDKMAILPKEYPVTMELFDAKGQLYEKRITNKHLNGLYPLPLATQRNDQTGTWRIRVKAGENTFEKSFKLETIRPNRIKSSLIFENKMLSRENEPFFTTIKADWLHGVPASGLKAIVELRLKNEKQFFSTFPSFHFENEFFKTNQSDYTTVFNNQLDESGIGSFPLNISQNPEISGKLTAIFQTRVFEPSGEFSTTVEKATYHPFTSYVGFEIPVNSWGEQILPENKTSLIRFAVVDKNGKPLQNKQVRISLFKSDWYWWWDNNQYQNADFNTETAKKSIKEITLSTDSKGLAIWRLQIKEWGRYLLLAEDLASGHRSAKYIHAGFPDGATNNNEKDLLSLMPVKTDKPKYKPGDNAVLTFPGSNEGMALVTIENGSRVLKTFRVKTQKGDNTIRVPIKEDMAPNVYAYISFIQGYETVKNDLPIRLFGICPVYVENPSTVLKPNIQTKESFKPGEKISIAISEDKGNEMTYTLSVVDEGLLGITRFKTPDPFNAFYAKVGLGIRTWDIYNKILGTFGATLGNLLAVGGDDSYKPDALNNTGTQFNSVVLHSGPFHLKKGQKSIHHITLPNYMGAVRIMAVAKNKEAYGSAEKTVPVKSPVMLFASAPRTLSPGDQFSLPVNIFISQPNLDKVIISGVDEAGILINKNKSVTLNLNGKKEGMVLIPFTVTEKTGLARLKINLASSRGSAFQWIEIPVRNPNPVAYRIASKVLNPGETWVENLSSFGQKGTRQIMLETSVIPNISIQKRLAYLLNYPYGCLEQTVSIAFSQLYLEKWINLNPQQEKQRIKHIKSAIQQINKFQLSSGGFSYWPGQFQFDEWITSYAGQFLLEAKMAGFVVPSNMLQKWEKFQLKLVKGLYINTAWASSELTQMNQAYRLYTLALAGKPEKGAMNQLKETKLYLSAANRLAGAYALAGNKEVGKKILLSKNRKGETQSHMETYGSDDRDRAQLLETYVLLGNNTKAATLATQLSKSFSSSNWYSTHSTAYVLLALSKYLGEQKPGEAINYQFNTAETKGKWVDVSHNRSIGLTQWQDFSGKQKIKIKNKGKSKLFLQLLQSGRESLGEVKATSSGIDLSVQFYDKNGQQLTPEEIPQGEDFKAEIIVKHTGENPYTYNDLALTQVFPSGWEMINDRITNSDATQSNQYDYTDVRDDRTSYFFNLGERQIKKFTVRLNATFSGRYYFPAATVSDMYHHQINAQTSGSWINVKSNNTNLNE